VKLLISHYFCFSSLKILVECACACVYQWNLNQFSSSHIPPNQIRIHHFLVLITFGTKMGHARGTTIHSILLSQLHIYACASSSRNARNERGSCFTVVSQAGTQNKTRNRDKTEEFPGYHVIDLCYNSMSLTRLALQVRIAWSKFYYSI
jgi:hypothetical protein